MDIQNYINFIPKQKENIKENIHFLNIILEIVSSGFFWLKVCVEFQAKQIYLLVCFLLKQRFIQCSPSELHKIWCFCFSLSRNRCTDPSGLPWGRLLFTLSLRWKDSSAFIPNLFLDINLEKINSKQLNSEGSLLQTNP